MSLSRTTVAGLVLLLVFGSLLTAVAVSTPNKSEETATVSVSPHPDDGQLQREDEVVVKNASDQLAANLSLIVHRVDALVGGDEIRNRFVIDVGGISSVRREARFSSEEFYGMTATGQRLMGFPETRQKRNVGPVALASSPPESRNATIYLPLPRQIAPEASFSYEFILAHEVGNVVDVSGVPDRELPETPLTDISLAYTAVNEGAANRVGERYVRKYSGSFEAEAMAPEADDHWRTRVTKQLYYEGYQYMAARQLNGSERVAVSSTAEILHPETNRTTWQLPETTFERRLEGITEPVDTNRAGELMIGALLVARGASPSRAERVAVGWRNGRIDQYRTEGQRVAVWTTEWRNETAAASFTEAYSARVPATRVENFEERFDTDDCSSGKRIINKRQDSVEVVYCH